MAAGMKAGILSTEVADVSVRDLADWIHKVPDLCVVDVREAWELKISGLPCARHIPMRQILEDPLKLPEDAPVVLICRNGHRTAVLMYWLQEQGFRNVYNVVGGLNAWSSEVDPTMRQY